MKFSFANCIPLTMFKTLEMISSNRSISELEIETALVKLDLQACLLGVNDAIAFMGMLNWIDF